LIAVDGLRPENTQEDHSRFKQYVHNLRSAYNSSHQRIAVANTHLDIGGNINQTLDLIQTRFMYVIQHDLEFIQDVNHSAVIKLMKAYPDSLPLVRFNKRPNLPYSQSDHTSCWGEKNINGTYFVKTAHWSDNNHLTTVSYYKRMFEMLRMIKRAPENAMQKMGRLNCGKWGTHLYGRLNYPPMIRHLDGRFTLNETIR